MTTGEVAEGAGPIDRISAFVSNILIVAACVAVALMMVHVVADVLGKWLFNHPIAGTFETVEDYYMVALVFLPFAYVARTEGHIYVELFTRNMRPRTMAMLEIAVGLLTLAWMCVLTWYTGEEAIELTANNDLRQISGGFLLIWPARWFLPLGCSAMAVVVLLQFIQNARTLSRLR